MNRSRGIGRALYGLNLFLGGLAGGMIWLMKVATGIWFAELALRLFKRITRTDPSYDDAGMNGRNKQFERGSNRYEPSAELTAAEQSGREALRSRSSIIGNVRDSFSAAKLSLSGYSQKAMWKAGFSPEQMKEVWQGFEHGLSKKEVGLFAKNDLSPDEMTQIRLGLEHGLSKSAIKIYNEPWLQDSQKTELRLGLESGLSKRNVRFLRNLNVGPEELREARCGLEHGLNRQAVKKITESSRGNPAAMCAGREVFEAQLKLSPKTLRNAGFDRDQIKQIRLAKEHGLSFAGQSLLADRELSWGQMEQIREGLEDGLSAPAISLLANKALSVDQMKAARDVFAYGLDADQARQCITPQLNADSIRRIGRNIADSEGLNHYRVDGYENYEQGKEGWGGYEQLKETSEALDKSNPAIDKDKADLDRSEDDGR